MIRGSWFIFHHLHTLGQFVYSRELREKEITVIFFQIFFIRLFDIFELSPIRKEAFRLSLSLSLTKNIA